MQMFRKIITAGVLYVLIPAAILNMIYRVADLEFDRISDIFSKAKVVFSGTPVQGPVAPPSPAPSPTTLNVATSSPVVSPLDTAEDITNIGVEFSDQAFSADDILADKLNRLPQDFKVSPDLKPRVAFWFD